MRTISISISDLEYSQFGINKDDLSFAKLIGIVNSRVTQQALDRCVQLAEKYKLSKLTMDEISNEVKAARNAKYNH